MFDLFYPRKYYNSIFEIDLGELKQKGITGIIVDLDNTLIAWNENEAPEKLRQWLKKVAEMGFRVCIASNNRFARATAIAVELQLPLIARAWKPRQKAFKRGMAILKTQRAETAVIGDQIFTDVLGGNRMGLYTILVVPISQKELPTTKLLRRVERLILRRVKREE